MIASTVVQVARFRLATISCSLSHSEAIETGSALLYQRPWCTTTILDAMALFALDTFGSSCPSSLRCCLLDSHWVSELWRFTIISWFYWWCCDSDESIDQTSLWDVSLWWNLSLDGRSSSTACPVAFTAVMSEPFSFINGGNSPSTGWPKKKRAPTLIRHRFLVFRPNEMKIWS